MLNFCLHTYVHPGAKLCLDGLNLEVKNVPIHSSPTRPMDAAEKEEEDEPILTRSTSTSKLCEYLRVLAAFRRQCEEQGQYQEAKRAHQQLQRLFREEESRRCQEWLERHALERNEREAAHEQQVREFQGQWAAFLDEYDRTSEASVQALKARHAEELGRLHQSESERGGRNDEPPALSFSSSSSPSSFSSFSSSLSSLTTSTTSATITTAAPAPRLPPVKFSRELLEWRRKERSMVQQHQYNEADKIKKLADRLEAKERQRSQQGHTTAVSRKQDKLKLQHQAELQALRARIATKRTRHEKQRVEDGRRLVQRNRNLLVVLVGKQNAEATAAFNGIRRELERIVAGAAAAAVAHAAGDGEEVEAEGEEGKEGGRNRDRNPMRREE